MTIGITKMSYVNFRGEPITEVRKAPRARPSLDRGPRHKGWLAVGFSPEHLVQAERDHAAASERARAAGAPPLPPFSAEAYMRRSKPGRIRSKPYELTSAAHEACRIAERSGWLNCSVQEMTSR